MKISLIRNSNLVAIVTFFISSLLMNAAYGQCTNTSSYGSATAPTGSGNVTISSCNYQTEYSTINSIVSGSTYTVTNSLGGCITVRRGSPTGPVVTFGPAPLTFTATTSGTYYLHYTLNCSCATATGCGTTTIACTSCGGGASGPCASITPITGCGTAMSTSLSGTGLWPSTPCWSSSPGVESIFSFTATASGIHTLNVLSASGGWVDFAWKLASGGCSQTGWTCIDDVLSPGSYGSMNWVAGQTYYILLDPETTSLVNFTFRIDCPNPTGPVTAGDCFNAYSICTDLNFAINPNGFGLVDEICDDCPSNPNVNPASSNNGCLLSGELNSTWVLVNVAVGGTLEFSLGAPAGSNCYDWAMWPYSPTACSGISGGTLAPIRCNYNLPCNSFTGVTNSIPPSGYAGNFEPTINAPTGSQYIMCFSNYSSVVTNVPLSFFGTADISCTPLPIEMVNFIGRGMRGFDQLKWSTMVEINSDYFEIVSSVDGHEFEVVGKVDASGGSNVQVDYTFDYEVNQTESRYYRLKQYDINGAFKYSDIIVVSRNTENEFRVIEAYPNPASDEFNVYFNLPQDGKVTTKILSSNGSPISNFENTYGAGGNIIKFPTSQLNSGFYFVELTFNDGQAVEVVKLMIK